MTESTELPDLGDEADRYTTMRADLLSRGYRDIEHATLRPGQRVRHHGERWPEAYDNGTGVVLAVMQYVDSPWSRSYGSPDIELIVLKDEPLLPDMSRLSHLANYHVATVAAEATR